MTGAGSAPEKEPALLRGIAIAAMLCIAGGLSFSHSLISIGVAGLLISSILSPAGRVALIQTYPRWRWLYLPFLLLYVLHGVSWLYTENGAQWLVEMRVKLPFLFLLPVSIIQWQYRTGQTKKVIHLSFHLGLLVVGLWTLGRLIGNPVWALEEIRQGRYIPMPGGISHIYYAGLVGMGLFFLWILPAYGGRWMKIGIAALYAVILHGLALRTGLAALYGTGIILLGLWALRAPRRWIWMVAGVSSLALLTISLIRYFPPMQRRWESLREDLGTYQPGGYITHSSVARRLAALEASWRAFRRSPWFGVGIADNQAAVSAEIPALPYRWSPETYILPHNQFVEYAVGLGLVGAGIFMLFWIGAFWQRLGWVWTGWLIYWLLLLQVEAFLERQVGVTAFLWGTGILWAQLTARKS